MKGILLFSFVFSGFICYGQNSIPEKVGEEIYKSFSTPHPYSGYSKAIDKPVWEQYFHEKGAGYLAFHFKKIELAAGDFLIVRNPENTRSWKYTNEEIKAKKNSFWSIHIYGEDAVIEIFSSSSSQGGFGYEIDKIAKGFLVDLSDVTSKAICGNDDSENAVCYENTEPCVYENSRPVARLLINGVTACTGWLMGDDGHLISNQHCVTNQSDANNTTIEFMAEGPNCGSNCNTWFGCAGIIEATFANVVRINANLDYALLMPPANVSGTYGFLRLRSNGAQLDERIYIPQHPLAWGKRIALFSSHPNETGGFARINSLSEPGCTSTNYNDVGYFADTRQGSSGSPVISYNDNLVIALHHCADCPNRGVPIQLIINDLGSDLPNNSITTISGPDYLCSTNTFTLQNTPAGSTVSWSASPTNLFTGSTSGSGTSAPLSVYSSFASGQATITFEIETDCGEVELQQSFWVGKPSTPGPIILGNTAPTVGSYEMYLLTSGIPPGATSMTWWLPYCFGCTDPWSIYSGHNLIQMVAIVGDSPGYVQAMGNNTCGNGPASLLYVVPDLGGGSCNPCPFIYPNPASDELFVEWRFEEAFRALDETEEYEVALYDMQGARLFSGKSSSVMFRMDLSKLRNGFYYIHILHKEGLIRKQIRVER